VSEAFERLVDLELLLLMRPLQVVELVPQRVRRIVVHRLAGERGRGRVELQLSGLQVSVRRAERVRAELTGC
jgi:hypothetical protein